MHQRRLTVCAVIMLLGIACGCARSPEARRDKYLARGKALLVKHEYSRAILEFRNAAKAVPTDAEPYYQIGVASEDARDFRAAIAFFRKALEENPKHAGAQLKLAQLMTASSSKEFWKDAQRRLTLLKQSEPESPDVLNTLALTEMKLGETDQAVENLQEALAKTPDGLRSSLLLAQAKLWQRDDSGAEQVLLKACETDPKSADARVILGEFYLIEKKPAQGEAEFQRALAIDPKNGQALIQLGNLQRSQGRKQEADETFKRLAGSGQQAYKAVHAQFLFEEGRYEEAIQEFQKLAKENPGDRLARTHLIAAYQTLNRTADAQNVLNDALRKNSKDLDALLQRAEIFLAAKKFGPAQQDLNAVLQLRPNSGEAHYIMAKLYQALGQSYSYRQELSEALRLDPHLLPIRIELASSFIQDKQAQAALDTLNAAPGTQGNTKEVLTARNWAYLVMGDLPRMRQGINEGLARERSPELVLQDGIYKLRTGDYEGARAALEEALKTHPADVRALSGLTQSYYAQKQVAEALDKVQEYASREPHSAAVQEFFGKVLLLQGKREQARKAFETAKIANPHFVDADLSLTQLDLVEGKIDDARTRLEGILATDNTNKLASLWLANIEVTKGKYDAAIDHYRLAGDAGNGNPQALNNLAFLLAEYRHELDEALKYAQKAVELSPNNGEYRDTLGWIYYRKGLYPSAIAELESAAAKSDNALWKYHLAMAYIKSGDLERGRENLQLALARNPNLTEAKEAEDMLGQDK